MFIIYDYTFRQTLNKQCALTLLSGLAIGFTVAYVALSQHISLTDPHSSYEMEFLEGPTVDPGNPTKI